jgi:hypothetical protein
MSDLIRALQILVKYGDHACPVGCQYGELVINYIDPSEVSEEDREELFKLGFQVCGYRNCFFSSR